MAPLFKTFPTGAVVISPRPPTHLLTLHSKALKLALNPKPHKPVVKKFPTPKALNPTNPYSHSEPKSRAQKHQALL